MQKITDLKGYLSKISGGEKVYSFLTSITEETPKGRHDFNDNVYVNVVSYETKGDFDGVFECHREYIDLHVLIHGAEKIYYGKKEEMKITKAYDMQGDYELLKCEKYSCVNYTAMQGVECEINEPHMAGGKAITPQKILKAIVKIKDRDC